MLARPYIARLRVFNRLICPSVWPLLQPSVSAFLMASISRRIMRAKRWITCVSSPRSRVAAALDMQEPAPTGGRTRKTRTHDQPYRRWRVAEEAEVQPASQLQDARAPTIPTATRNSASSTPRSRRPWPRISRLYPSIRRRKSCASPVQTDTHHILVNDAPFRPPIGRS